MLLQFFKIMLIFVPINSDYRMKRYEKRHLPYKLYVVRERLETYYADWDLTKVTPRRMLADAYVFTEDDLSALIKLHGDRINLITKDEELKVGFYNVISFDDYGMDVYLDIKTFFEYNKLGEYDTDQIEPLITKHLQDKKSYNNLMDAVIIDLIAKNRKKLGELIEQIQVLVDEVDKIGEAEQEKYDNLIDVFQETEVGKYCQDVAFVIKEQCDSIKYSLNRLRRIVKGNKNIILPF